MDLQCVICFDLGVFGKNATKKAKIETGYELKVPLFIKEGDEILINTESREYVKRL